MNSTDFYTNSNSDAHIYFTYSTWDGDRREIESYDVHGIDDKNTPVLILNNKEIKNYKKFKIVKRVRRF